MLTQLAFSALSNDNTSAQAKHDAEVKLHGISKLKDGEKAHE
jgi:hypothetical protein